MDRQYAPLQVKQVRQGALLCKPERGVLRRIGLDDPATLVMARQRGIELATEGANAFFFGNRGGTISIAGGERNKKFAAPCLGKFRDHFHFST